MLNSIDPLRNTPVINGIQAGKLLSILHHEVKKLIRVTYFLPPGINPLDKSHFLHPSIKNHMLSQPVKADISKTRKLTVITGATSGIGKAFAHHFARQGYDLLITGRRREVITGVAEELKNNYSINVEVVIADLSKNEDLSLLLQIIGKKKNIEVLVNNAGYGMRVKFREDEIDHQIAMLKVHVHAPLMLIHKVLPMMMEKKNGTIINVSSLAAFLPTSGNAMYTSTKSFLMSFTESLHMDVRHYGIRVQCLCPGFTYSDFHRDRDINPDSMGRGIMRWMNPADVVDYSMQCLDNRKILCIPGIINRVLSLLIAGMPRNLYYLIAVRLEKKIRKNKEIPHVAYSSAVQ
jgi:short-subunit dehydrogenase